MNPVAESARYPHAASSPELDSKNGPFEALAREALRSAKRFAYRLTKNHEDADDLVQDTLIQAFRAFRQFTPGSSFQAWLNRIMLNLFCKRARSLGRERRNLELKEAIVSENRADIPLDSAVATRLGLALADAIDRLSEEYSEICYRALVLEQSYEVIAMETGIAIATVRTRIFRGRRALREALTDAGWFTSECEEAA